MAREYAPVAVVGGSDISYRDELSEIVGEAHGSHAGARHTRDREAINHHVRCALQINAIRRRVVSLIDENTRFGKERNGCGCRAARVQIEARVVSGTDGDHITGSDSVGRML